MKKIVFVAAMSLFLAACSTSKKVVETEDTEVKKETNVITIETKVVTCEEITYTNTVKAILDRSCIKCHTGAKAKHGVELSTYAGASKVDSHELICVVDWDSEEKCDRMPPIGKGLSGVEIKQLSCWVENGHQQ